MYICVSMPFHVGMFCPHWQAHHSSFWFHHIWEVSTECTFFALVCTCTLTISLLFILWCSCTFYKMWCLMAGNLLLNQKKLDLVMTCKRLYLYTDHFLIVHWQHLQLYIKCHKCTLSNLCSMPLPCCTLVNVHCTFLIPWVFTVSSINVHSVYCLLLHLQPSSTWKRADSCWKWTYSYRKWAKSTPYWDVSCCTLKLYLLFIVVQCLYHVVHCYLIHC